MYIEKINGPEDVKKLSNNELTSLAAEMRQALLKCEHPRRTFRSKLRYGRSNDCFALCI